MRLGVLALSLALAACTTAEYDAPFYPIHPARRSAAGGPIQIRGAVARPGVIPYALGMTLRCAVRLAGGIDRSAGEYGRLQRFDGSHHDDLPIRAIVDGRAPDFELAPGDRVTVFRGRVE